MGWTTELFKTSFVFESNDDENKNEDDVQEELEAAGDSEDDGQEKLEAADDNYASLDPLGIAEKSEAQEAGVAKRGSKAQEALDAKDSGAGESGTGKETGDDLKKEPKAEKETKAPVDSVGVTTANVVSLQYLLILTPKFLGPSWLPWL